ncbi:MAG TPA: hypothetical protein VLT82_03215 [Myxococcaceae bacterium]|nr:hypothetical protein [Myxococcaceae bacterium]
MRRPQPWAVVASWSALWGALLFAAGAAAQPAEPAAPAPRSEAAAPAPEAAPTVPEAADPRAGWRHEFSPAWHMATFWNKENSHYTFHSLSIGYLMSVNAAGPFVHLSWVIPLQARQDGSVHSVSSLYQNGGGIDLLLGWQWRKTVTQELEFEGGPGLHMNALNLGGKPGLTNFNALQLGLGGMTILRFRPGWTPHKVGWTVGAVGALAFDLYDPLRSNDLRIGIVLRIGVVLGVDLP